MRKISRKGIEKKLDEVVKLIAFARDGECVTCPLWLEIKKGNPQPHIPSWVMQPGHFITRGAHAVKWDLRNVYQQCKTCNYLHEYHPEVLANYVVNTLGVEEFEKLVFDGNKTKKYLMPELEELYIKLEKIKETK
jgi:hypothetical protein